MTRGDRIIVAIVACTALLSVPMVTAAAGSRAHAAVVRAPGGRTVLDLGKDAVYEIQGRDGVLHLRVLAGQVRAVDAECPDQVCVLSGVARPGRPVVCAPNGVSVTLDDSEGMDLDAVSR